MTVKVEDFSPVVRISLTGHLAQLEVYKLKCQVEDFIAHGKRFLVLDLKKIDYIDSAGIGSLLHMRTQTQRLGGDMCIVKPDSKNVFQILQLTSLQKIFTFHEDADTALKAIRKKNGLGSADDDDAPVAVVPVAVNPTAAEADSLVSKLSEYEARIDKLEQRLEDLEKKIA